MSLDIVRNLLNILLHMLITNFGFDDSRFILLQLSFNKKWLFLFLVLLIFRFYQKWLFLLFLLFCFRFDEKWFLFLFLFRILVDEERILFLLLWSWDNYFLVFVFRLLWFDSWIDKNILLMLGLFNGDHLFVFDLRFNNLRLFMLDFRLLDSRFFMLNLFNNYRLLSIYLSYYFLFFHFWLNNSRLFMSVFRCRSNMFLLFYFWLNLWNFLVNFRFFLLNLRLNERLFRFDLMLNNWLLMWRLNNRLIMSHLSLNDYLFMFDFMIDANRLFMLDFRLDNIFFLCYLFENLVNNNYSSFVILIDGVNFLLLSYGKWFVFLINFRISNVEFLIFWLFNYFVVPLIGLRVTSIWRTTNLFDNFMSNYHIAWMSSSKLVWFRKLLFVFHYMIRNNRSIPLRDNDFRFLSWGRNNSWIFLNRRNNNRYFLFLRYNNLLLMLRNNSWHLLWNNLCLNLSILFFLLLFDIFWLFRHSRFNLLFSFLVDKNVGLSLTCWLSFPSYNCRLNLSHCFYFALTAISISSRQANIRFEMGSLRCMQTMMMTFVLAFALIFMIWLFTVLMDDIFGLRRYYLSFLSWWKGRRVEGWSSISCFVGVISWLVDILSWSYPFFVFFFSNGVHVGIFCAFLVSSGSSAAWTLGAFGFIGVFLLEKIFWLFWYNSRIFFSLFDWRIM